MKRQIMTVNSAGSKFAIGKKLPAAPPWAFALLFGVLGTNHLAAEGFRNPPAGAFNLSRAGGRIAQVDDASAISQNPANLVELSAPEYQFTPSVVYIKVDYHSPDGDTASTSHPWKMLPNMFLGAPLYENRLAVGLGITTPYGLANEWDKDSTAFKNPAGWRYQAAHFGSLMTINFRPTVAVKAGEHLTLGAGLDVMWSKVTLKQYYPWALVTSSPDPDGTLKAVSTGVGAGANFGATWHITQRQRLALTLQTPIRIDYEGNAHIGNKPASLGGSDSVNRDFSTHIKYPLIITGGYGIELTDKIRLESDVEWLQFSNFKNLPLNVSGPSLGVPSSVPQNWKDTFTIGLAGDWKFATNWVFRAGYRFYESPVPDSTFSPTIPDANQNVITVGLGYTHGKHSLELAYGYDFYDDRVIKNNQNPVFNGKYSMTVHLFSLAYRYAF